MRCEPCGKRAYPTMRSAIGSAIASSRARGVSLRFYRCPIGNGWHLTSQTEHAKEAS